MSTRPTPEQIAEARARLTALLSSDLFRRTTAASEADALRKLLAITEPPTDEALDAEAIDWCAQGECLRSPVGELIAAYAAGARREGRRA